MNLIFVDALVSKIDTTAVINKNKDVMNCSSNEERETRLEPATPTLARSCSTN